MACGEGEVQPQQYQQYPCSFPRRLCTLLGFVLTVYGSLEYCVSVWLALDAFLRLLILLFPPSSPPPSTPLHLLLLLLTSSPPLLFTHLSFSRIPVVR